MIGERTSRLIGWGPTIAGGVAVLTGGLWLTAWLGGWAARWAAVGDAVTMKTNTALCLLLAGVALLLVGPNAAPRRRLVGAALGFVVLLTGGLTLAEHLAGVDLGIDQLLAKEAPGAFGIVSPNRPGPPASLSFVLLGAALVARALGRRKSSPYLGLAVTLVNLVPGVGFLYGIGGFHEHPHLTAIAWPTMVALLALGVGLVLLEPERGPMAVLLRQDAGGALVRQALPAVVLIPLLLGLLEARAESLGWVGGATGTGFQVIAMVVLLGVLLWRSAERLSSAAAREAEARREASAGEARFTALFEAAPIAMSVASVPDGVVRDVNRAWLDLMGFGSKNEVVGRTSHELGLVADVETRNRNLEELAGSRSTRRFELPIRTRSGAARTLLVDIHPVEIDGRPHLVSGNVDITDLRQAQEEAFAARERLAALMSALPVGVSFSDDPTCQRVSGNPTLLAQFEIQTQDSASASTLDEVAAGRRVRYFEAGREVADHELPLQRAVAENREIGPVELEILLPSGRRWYSSVSGAPIRDRNGVVVGGVAVTLDVTHQKRAQDALRESEDKYRTIVEATQEGIVIGGLDGKILFVNARFASMLGYSPDELLGRAGTELLDSTPVARVEETRRLLDTGGSTQLDCCFRRSDGRLLWTLATATPLRDAAGNHVANLTMHADITERKRAESELQRMRLLLEQGQVIAHLGSFEYLAETGTTIWSEEEFRIYGLDPAGPSPPYDVMLAESIHPDDAELLDRTFTGAMRNGSVYELEHRIVRPDGSVRWVHDRAHPHFGPDGRLVRYFGATLDITERKQAEAALRQAQATAEAAAAARAERQRFLDVLDTLPVVIDIIRADHTVEWANRAYRDSLGDNVGRKCHASQFGFDEPCRECQAFVPLSTGRPHNWEWTLPDGRTFDIYNYPFTAADDSPAVLEMDVDITERRRAEAAMREASAYNRSLIEASVDPLVTIGPDGRITDVNSATELVTGLGRDALVGQDFSDCFTEPASARAGYQAVFREGTVKDYPLEIRHRDGHTTPVLYNAAVYRDAAGRVLGVFAAARDVTEVRRAEAALRAFNETLERRGEERTAKLQASEAALQASLREKEVLLKEIHHRVKNNLQIIASMLNLQASALTDEAAREPLWESQNRVKTIALIHEKLYGSHDLSSVAFSAYVDELAGYLHRSFRESARAVRLDVDAQDIQLDVGTAIPLALVLNELVTNAFKHGFPDRRSGVVRVEFHRDDTGSLCLSVANDGVGIPEDVDPHNTQSLGLQLVSVLAQQLDATLELRRTPMTSFTLKVPKRA